MPVGVLSHRKPESIMSAVATDRGPLFAELDYDSTLEDLVRCNDTSVRLCNCIVNDPNLGHVAIGEYLANPEAAFVRSLRTPNLGKKTAIELRLLVESFAFGCTHGIHKVGSLTENSDGCIPAVQPRDVILAILRQFRFPDAPLQLDIGVRLRNVLDAFAKCQRDGEEPGVLFPTLADVVERWHEAAPALLGFKNLGRKSLDELKRAVENLLHHRLANLIPADRLPPALTLDVSLENVAPKLAKSLIEIYPSLSEAAINPNDPQFVLDAGIDIREQIERIISGLSNKERGVLYRRFGLQGYRTKTLEEIGNEFYVTRERVRQVEARAIRRLQVGTRFAAFKHLLDREANALWDTLSLGSELLLPDDLEQRHRSIDPVQELAVTVVYGDLGKWVSDASTPFGAGWIRSDRPVEAVRPMVGVVENHLCDLPLPRSVGGVAEDLDITPEDVALAVRASGRFRVFEDFIVDGIVGPQARRTVRFHKVFLEQQGDNLLDFAIPLGTYQTRYPEDDAGARVFDLQMRRAPHLFSAIFDSIWLPLPDEGVSFRRRGVIRYNTADFAADREFDDDTIGNWLARKLHELGLTRAVDLRDHATAELSP